MPPLTPGHDLGPPAPKSTPTPTPARTRLTHPLGHPQRAKHGRSLHTRVLHHPHLVHPTTRTDAHMRDVSLMPSMLHDRIGMWTSKRPKEPRSDRRRALDVPLSLARPGPVAHPVAYPIHTRTHTHSTPRIHHPLKRNERHKRVVARVMQHTRRRDSKRPQEPTEAE